MLISGCLTQFIYFTRDYLKYPTVQKINPMTKKRTTLPAVIICDTKFTQIGLYQNNTGCRYEHFTSITKLMRDSVVFIKKPNLFCATYFSRFHSKNKLFKNCTFEGLNGEEIEIGFTTKAPIQFLGVQSAVMPPQQTELFHVFYQAIIKSNVVIQVLMPAPFDTDCFNYSGFSEFISHWDCKYRSKFFLQNSTEFYFNDFDKLEKVPKNYFKLNKERNLLKQCKKSCFFENYFNMLRTNVPWTAKHAALAKAGMISQDHFVQKNLKEVFIVHEEGINLLYFIIQLGAMIAFWFDISLHDLMQKLNRFVLKSCFQIFKGLALITCVVQVCMVIDTYLSYETVTKITLEHSYENSGILPMTAFSGIFPRISLISHFGQIELARSFTENVVPFISGWNKQRIEITKTKFFSNPTEALCCFLTLT